jgi:preprotein translocase subunit SecA
MGLEGEGTTEDELWELGSRDAILEHLLDLADARLEKREAEIGEADWAMVERMVLLRTIDSLWVDHLTEIDDMRRGIGLRGYAQQDPLNEFRREAFQLYGELRDLIRHQVATTIFRVTVTRQAPPGESSLAQSLAAGAARLAAGAAGAGVAAAAGAAGGGSTGTATVPRPGAGGPRPIGPVVSGGLPSDPMARARSTGGSNGAGDGGARPGFTPSGARIGRNDPCWCGSGLKYKKCHGR